ncbi:hypothetical protein FDG2_2999 [Candidatus Protofrankia californiensis]|uniref:Uncharacterized protein n=1 Tax=Candidatus Protofrankia californiensis TaxID=1839754 RepID=A0A1C3NYP6_9ACTN|nr:hypothetical protein FDG2_2999 [Candidatus Protofrankia californiensis]
MAERERSGIEVAPIPVDERLVQLELLADQVPWARRHGPDVVQRRCGYLGVRRLERVVRTGERAATAPSRADETSGFELLHGRPITIVGEPDQAMQPQAADCAAIRRKPVEDLMGVGGHLRVGLGTAAVGARPANPPPFQDRQPGCDKFRHRGGELRVPHLQTILQRTAVEPGGGRSSHTAVPLPWTVPSRPRHLSESSLVISGHI